MVEASQQFKGQPERIAVIGFSSTACRTVGRLADAGAPVLFVIDDDSRANACSLTTNVELISLPRLLPAGLPIEIGGCRAAVVASDDEQLNLHVTMQLSSDYPSMKIVTRLFNLGLGREIEERMPNVTVLSVSELAAPFFAAAAFLDGIQEAWRKDDRLMANIENQGVAPVRADNTSPLQRSDGTDIPNVSRKTRPDKMLLAVLAGIILVVAAGTLFFWTTLRMSIGDALYFVVTTLTTTGYGDYSLREHPFYTKLVGMALMLSGASLFAILFAIDRQAVQDAPDLIMGRRQVKAAGHVVVCGAGDVGIRVVECLRLTGAETVVVERDQNGRFNQRIHELGIPLIVDDATLEETLDRAAVRQARAIICATDNDMRNLEVALNARSLNPSIRIVVRVYDRDFADQMQRNFRIEAALSSSAIASNTFAAAARGAIE
jgi:voltage-gated potassium channel Kch